MYTDNTVLPRGRYKFTALCRVPPSYLLTLYTQPNSMGWDPDLYEYIEANIERIHARSEGRIDTPTLRWPCEKVTYLDKGEANRALDKIRNISTAPKIPVRSYECERCGFWHLTSKQLTEYQQTVADHQPKALPPEYASPCCDKEEVD